MSSIKIIDLFAGPGGLGEGFMSLKNEDNKSIFDIKLSIEKDQNAHRTLTWRSFYRQFEKQGKAIPKEYYDAYREPNLKKREELIEETLDKYPEGQIARKEARLVELGSEQWPKKVVDKMITDQLGENKNWVLIGGPPCQAYSMAGRSRVGGIDSEDHRVYLYKEYLRIIAEHHPAVFVMENVKGLLSAKVDGKQMFDLIKDDLTNPSSIFEDSNSLKYKVYSLSTAPDGFDSNGNPLYKDNKKFLIQTEKFNVPQKRHRVILLGIREDVKVTPGTLKFGEKEVKLKEVIGDLPKLRSGLGRSIVSSRTVSGKKKRVYKKEIDNNKNWENRINGFNALIHTWNGFKQKGKTQEIIASNYGVGAEFIKCYTPHKRNPLNEWYRDDNLMGVSNHETRTHLMGDLKRYLFASVYAEKYKRFPRLRDYDKHSHELMPDHESARSGKFADRFRVQMPDTAATTVTSHISKDGHYFIHYDPEQCRSLTVREAARIQTFPDNYLFRGPRTAQYHQVGNAVPPYLAIQIAEIVRNVLMLKD